MEDQRSDLQRVCDALDDLEPHASIETLRTLGGTLRRAHFDVTAVVMRRGADRRRARRHDRQALCHRLRPRHHDRGGDAARSRERPAGGGALDAQPPAALRRRRDHPGLGDDDGRSARSARCATAPTRRCAELTAEVLADAEVAPGEVYEITVCGNVTMMQIALGIDPEPLSMAPFTVADARVPAHPGHRLRRRRAPARARRSCSPRWAPTSAATSSPGMLATGLTRDRRLRLFIDVGTNSEIALGSVDRVLATAAPAGPAFEAAQINCGMRAADGAIEGIKINADGLDARGDRRRRAGRACAARASSTPSPSSSTPGCSTTPAASSPTRTPPSDSPDSLTG